MYRSDDYYRELIFSEWFEKYSKHYEMMRDGKFCDIRIDIKYAPFINTFNRVYKKNMRYYDTPMDCYSDCMAAVWEGMLNFKILNNSTWQYIAEKKDVDNYKKLVSYLKTFVTQNVKKLNQECLETSTLINNGKKKKLIHIYYNISPESLNQITTFDNSLEKIELINTVENSYWEKQLNYKYGIFAEWAKDNMDKHLTESQKKLLITLREANYSSLDNEYNKEELENTKGQIKLKLERICDKVISRYSEERKLITGGYVVQEIDAELKSYQKIMNAVSNENCNSDTLLQMIISSMNNKYWERLLYEDIDNKTLMELIRVYKNNTIVYEDDFKLYNNKTKVSLFVICKVINAIIDRTKYLIKAREYEMSLLKDEAGKRNAKIKQMYFEIPENFTTVYLKVTPSGIMIQK